jgi:hypothetical protein
MIDTVAIVFSLGMVIFIAVRAALLDRQLPWFGRRPPAVAHGRIHKSRQ